MSKLEQLRTTFLQRFNELESRNVSAFLFAEQVAKYEIFCIVLKKFIESGPEQTATSLLESISAQQDDFLLQVIGLTHLGTHYRQFAAPTKADLSILVHFFLANYYETLVQKDEEIIQFADSPLPQLEDFYKQKQWFDQDLVTHISTLQTVRKERPIDLKQPDTYIISARMAIAEDQRCKMAQQYLGAFEVRVNLERAARPPESKQPAILDRQINEANHHLQNLSKLAKLKMERVLSAPKEFSAREVHFKSPCRSPYSMLHSPAPKSRESSRKKKNKSPGRSTKADSGALKDNSSNMLNELSKEELGRIETTETQSKSDRSG